MTAVDKGDSADFTEDEILNPKDWVLMNFLMDARTGLGRFHDFRISNYDLMMELIDYCVNHSIKEVLELPDVKERVDLYMEQSERFKAQLKEISHMDGKVIVVDQKAAGDTIYAGNRFMIYALYPEAEISVHVAWGFKKQNTAVMIGKSIINRSSKFNIGELCLEYGGGGHANAGTCQIDNDKIDSVLPEIRVEFYSKQMKEYADIMRQLKDRLSEPFVTVNTVTGDTGIKQAQDEYAQLIRNKSPKSRRK